MKKRTAINIKELYINIIDMIDSSIVDVSGREDNDQTIIYKRQCGKIMAEIMFGVLDPLYIEHPDLKPADW